MTRFGFVMVFFIVELFAAPSWATNRNDWCLKNKKNPPCGGAKGRCVKNEGFFFTQKGGFVADTASRPIEEIRGFFSRNKAAFIGIHAQVCDQAYVGPSTTIKGHAILSGQARADGEALIYDNAQVSENVQVSGSAQVYGNALISGNARIFHNARVFDDARISGNAKVFYYSQVFGQAEVSGGARIFDSAWVYENAILSGFAQVFDDAQVYGSAHVFENAWIHDEGKVFGTARIHDYAHVYENAEVFGEAHAFGVSRIYGHARISGSAQIYENAEIRGHVQVYENARVFGNVRLQGSVNLSGNIQVFDESEVQNPNRFILLSLLDESKSAHPSFPGSDGAQLTRLYLKRVKENEWIREYDEGDQAISIEDTPSQFLDQEYIYTLTDENFANRLQLQTGVPYSFLSLTDAQKAAILEQLNEFDHFPFKAEQGLIPHPDFDPIALTPGEELDLQNLQNEIQEALAGLPSLNSEHIKAHAYFDHRVGVHANHYDQKVFLKILLALKRHDRASFVKEMANLGSSFPQKHSQAKSGFLHVFSHLFVTGKFPSLAAKTTYFHFLLRCGQIYSESTC